MKNKASIVTVLFLFALYIIVIGQLALFEDGSIRIFDEGLCLISGWGCT